MRRPVLIAGACAVLALILAIAIPLLVRHRDASPASGGVATPIKSADLSGSGPGSLLEAMTMPGFVATAEGKLVHAARVTYRSTSGGTGQETVVTGSVFTPLGPPPPGGWPVIAFGHGTTGLDQPCAPSLSDSLLGAASIVTGYTQLGYAVALADYQGLGAPGVHPYTDARTAGLNMIDAVRALHRTFHDVSNRWAAVGGSQGGAAAWAADEQAALYAPELDLVGAVAYVPAADVSGIVDKALAGTVTTDQSLGLIAVVESLARLHPDLNRDDYRRGAAARYWDALTVCSGPQANERTDDAQHLRPGDVGPANADAADKLRDLLKAWAIPQKPLSAPLSVIYAGRDSFIDAAWTTEAIARACALGGTVVWELQSDKGHGDVDVASRFKWLADRFAGIPVTSQCA